jgi:hypothetical protein
LVSVLESGVGNGFLCPKLVPVEALAGHRIVVPITAPVVLRLHCCADAVHALVMAVLVVIFLEAMYSAEECMFPFGLPVGVDVVKFPASPVVL